MPLKKKRRRPAGKDDDARGAVSRPATKRTKVGTAATSSAEAETSKRGVPPADRTRKLSNAAPAPAAPFAGLVVEPPSALDADVHRVARHALTGLEPLYAWDATQPLGLGTALAKTRVTRCLCGDPGATYKYLGLRMFAHPWSSSSSSSSERHDAALAGIRTLDRALRRNAHRLGAANAAFTVALVNKMVPSTSYKKDAAVSWHADSCLEHFSTISVYQLLEEDSSSPNDAEKRHAARTGTPTWHLAVRVKKDAEGPNRGGPAVRGTKSQRCPPAPSTTEGREMAIPLAQSGSSYHMLDAFNHHHQHSVLCRRRPDGGPKKLPNGTVVGGPPESGCIRYSSTHRVARKEGHTAAWVVASADTALRKASSTAKRDAWRTTSRTLDVVEFEWLRQWYVQGPAHARRLGAYWAPVIATLEARWRQLERCEHSRVETLVEAAGRAAAPGKASRREKKKRRVVAGLGGIAAYDEALADLRARREKRRLWSDRETDAFWGDVAPDARPIAPPPFTLASSSDEATDDRLPIDLDGPIASLEAAREAYRRISDSSALVSAPSPSAEQSPSPQQTARGGSSSEVAGRRTGVRRDKVKGRRRNDGTAHT